MRRKDKQITDKSLLTEILNTAYICRVAFHDMPYPYIVPMNYAYYDDKLYFHCASTGKKLVLIRKNNRVGFEIEMPYEIIKAPVSCDWTTRYQSIVGTGEMHFIRDLAQKKQVMDRIMQQHGSPENRYKERLLEVVEILELQIHDLSGKQSGDW